MKIGDIVGVLHGTTERLYEVTGIHLGAIAQDSVYTMTCIDRAPASTTQGRASELRVPVCFIDTGIEAGVFTHFSPEDKP